jgi:HAD superfamily hydrolase (TIGR01509 family)
VERKLRGVILDVDGTLVDSNDAHARAWQEALKEHRIERPLTSVRRLIGMGGDKLLPELTGLAPDSAEAKSISERRSKIFAEKYLPQVKPFPGVRGLLLRMRAANLCLSVGSSAKEKELHPLLAIAQVEDLIHAVTSSSDVESSKPDPDIVEAAFGELHLRAHEVMMIGDTPYDIEAARRAGVEAIAFRCGGWDDAGLTGARAIYEGPAELLARFDSSPLAPAR